MAESVDHVHSTKMEEVDGTHNYVEDADNEPVQHVHAKTIILLIAIVIGYAGCSIHIVGVGLLTQSITTVVGGAGLANWLTATYVMGTVILGPPISQGADYWGRKWFLVVGFAANTIGCIVASRANSIGMVLAGQGITAIGQGCQPVLVAIPSEILPRKYRPLAQAASNTAVAGGAILGLLIGGSLTSGNPNKFRIYYYIVAGIYAFSLAIITLLYNPPVRELQKIYTTRQKLARLDWIGYALLTAGLTPFIFALTCSTVLYPWKSPKILAPIIVGGVVLIVFGLYEWKITSTGIVHHDLFSRMGRNFTLALLCVFVEGMVFISANNYFGFEIVAVYGQTLLKAGLYYTVTWFAAILSAWAAGVYCSRSKTLRLPTIVAFGFFALYMGLMASLNETDRKNTLGYSVFLGIGLGMGLSTLVVLAQLSTPPDLISVTTGLMIPTRSLGGTVGLAIYTAVFNSKFSTELVTKVTQETAPLGFDVKYLPTLLGGLTTGNLTVLDNIPNITPAIIQAGASGVTVAYVLAFRYVWVTAAAFCALALFCSFFIIDPTKEFNAHIDAPVETEEELAREGIVEKLHHRGHHGSEA